ncbi:DUF192 domain-containing protein [Persicitalea sp.]|uniref:DUF192 domain-containing protein n=1 Tax=Persicitalea sp. TaxID=3100273 RepID=UPI0035945E43
MPYLNERGEATSSPRTESTAATSFVKEGEVTFLSEGKTISKIDIEIAENEAEQSKGLMYRPYMPDSVGMLFVFQDSKPLGFWMKNTQIPLDIIYVDSNRKIVSIQKNAKPYSEENLPSLSPAQYVVEVNAGYVDQHGIAVGDVIQF